MKRTLPLFALLLSAALRGNVEEYAAKIAPLIAPAKLATLGSRGNVVGYGRCFARLRIVV